MQFLAWRWSPRCFLILLPAHTFVECVSKHIAWVKNTLWCHKGHASPVLITTQPVCFMLNMWTVERSISVDREIKPCFSTGEHKQRAKCDTLRSSKAYFGQSVVWGCCTGISNENERNLQPYRTFKIFAVLILNIQQTLFLIFAPEATQRRPGPFPPKPNLQLQLLR